MKKIFSKLILPIMALGIFAACDDVPSPYYVLSPEDAEYEIQGEGTSEDPYTVGDALTIINAGTYTSSPVFVEGIITQIDNIDTSYGNATYYIASESDINEDGSVNQQLEVYRGYYLNGDKFTSEDQMKVGDHVIVYGQITLYGSTPEVTQGSMLYEHNGKYSDNPESTTDPVGSGTWEDPYNVAAAKNVISTGTYTSDKVYVKGIVSKIDNIDTGYGNATYYISDDGTAAGQLEVYRGYSFGGARFASQDELKVGDEVDVKLLEIDAKTGKMRLSMRALTEKPEGYVEPKSRERSQRREGGNRNNGERRNGNDRGQRREGDRGSRRYDRRQNSEPDVF